MDQQAAQREERWLDAVERRVTRIALRADAYVELLLTDDGPQHDVVVRFPTEFAGIPC